MSELLVTFSMCFALCFLLERIETAINSKVNRIYKITHILYPMFIIGTMLYLLTRGMIK